MHELHHAGEPRVQVVAIQFDAAPPVHRQCIAQGNEFVQPFIIILQFCIL
jgi:hypothetical protein